MSDGYDKNVGHNITYNNTSKKEEGERAGAHEPSKIFLEHKINYPDVALEPRASTFIHNNKRVKIKLDKLEKLITDFGKEKIDEMIERLDEYADINPKRFKQYACHATVIRKWIRDDVSKMLPKRTEEAKKQEKEDRVERNMDFVFDFERRRPEVKKEGIELRVTKGAVEFRRDHSHVAQLSFSEHGFEEQFKNTLRKMGIE